MKRKNWEKTLDGKPEDQWFGDVGTQSCVDLVPDVHMGAAMGFMVGVRMVFSIVISPVFGARIPIVTKLVLGFLAMEPPKLHIHHFAPTRNNSIVGNTSGSGVISLDRIFGLGPSRVYKGLAVRNHLTCHDE
jgi:hypothetical protein